MKKRNIWQIIKQYHWESAFFRHCFKWFLIILIPTFAIGVLLTLYASNTTEQNIEQSLNFNSQKIIEQNKTIFSTIDDFHYSLSNDYNVAHYCLDYIMDGNEISITVGNIASLINTFVSSNQYIDSVYFYNHSNSYILSNQQSAYINNFYDTGWCYLIPEKQTAVVSRSVGNDEYITVFIPVYIGGYNIASAVYNIDVHKYMDLFSSNEYIPNIKLFNRNNVLIFSSKNESNALTPSKEFRSSISHHTYMMLSLYPTETAYMQKLMYWIFWIAFTILFVLDIVLSYHLSLNYFILIVENIMQFQSLYSDSAQAAELLTELDFLVHNPLKRSQTKDVEHFLINQYRQLNSSRMTSMQEQINPHFIFNTLNLISLIDLDDDSQNKGVISKITKNLADILRYSIETTSNIIPFTEEMMYLDKYMEIQNIKYEGKFNYVKETDPDSNGCAVIKFILQPIVENAINHGILTSPSKSGTITLKTKHENDNFIISISNDGSKIEPEKLASLNEMLKTYTDSNGKHIGMANVNNRIKLLYGKKYGCVVTSDDNLTTVTLSMPYVSVNGLNDK